MSPDDFLDRMLELCREVREKMTEEEWHRLIAAADALRSGRWEDDQSP